MAIDTLAKAVSVIGLAGALAVGSYFAADYAFPRSDDGQPAAALRKEDQAKEPISMKRLDELSVSARKMLEKGCVGSGVFSGFLDKELGGEYGERSVFVAGFRVKDRGGMVDFRGARHDYVCRIGVKPFPGQAMDIDKYTFYVESVREYLKVLKGQNRLSLYQEIYAGNKFLVEYTDIGTYLNGDEDRMYSIAEHASRDALLQLGKKPTHN